MVTALLALTPLAYYLWSVNRRARQRPVQKVMEVEG